jgi:hypothetical protein
LRTILLSALLLAVFGCRSDCTEGDNCARQCPEHAWGICTEDGMCRCQDFLEIIQDQKHQEMSTCRHPERGELVINEVMIDGEPTEAGEFVELVNTTTDSIRLDATSIFVARGQQMSRRLALDLGCIAPKGALLLAADSPAPLLMPPWSYDASYKTRRFGFSNTSDFVAEIRLFDTDVIDRVDLPHDRFRSGVSLVRAPDVSGVEFVDHRLVSGGQASSPGACSDGTPIDRGCPVTASSCMPPKPKWLVINEVMVDADPEAREFVEIANNTDRPIDLSGLRLLTEGTSTSSIKLEVWGGCLFPGELVAFYSHNPEALARDRLLATLVFDAYRFRFPNRTDTRLFLKDRHHRTIDEFLVPATQIDENTSVNRYPDVSGAEIIRHDRFFDERASPGLRALNTAAMQ